MIRKKGQEEIVGFVLIIVIVTVVFLVFLGISLRKGGETSGVKSESTEVYQFLESSMEFTTECAVRFENDVSILGELFEECYSGTKCLNEEMACDVLNKSLNEIFESSWQVGENRPVKGYEFKASYKSSDFEEEVISLRKGSCGKSVRGASYISPAFPGRIESVLQICN